MSLSRAELVGLYTRALREALESAAGAERAAAVLTRALSNSGLTTVPEELEAFRRFTDGPLRQAVERHLRPSEVEAIYELIAHVLWMATSDVQSQRASEEVDEASGARVVEGVPFRVPALPPTPVPPQRLPAPRTPGRPASGTSTPTTYASSSSSSSTPAVSGSDTEDLDTARVSPVPRERRASVTLGRVGRPRPPTGGVVEINPEAIDDSAARKRARLEVLVLTLDPLLVFETENGLAGRGHVTTIGTVAELARAASAATGKLVVVVDSALPSIDLPTFAPISGSLPPTTRIVLWGVDERQKQRLAAMFPAAKDWIASGRAASPAELILDL